MGQKIRNFLSTGSILFEHETQEKAAEAEQKKKKQKAASEAFMFM